MIEYSDLAGTTATFSRMLGGWLTVGPRRSIALHCRDYRGVCRGVEGLEFTGDVRGGRVSG